MLGTVLGARMGVLIMKEKMLSLEEWTKLRSRTKSYDEDLSLARQGMIPDDGSYINIPDVKDWPKEALGISVHFTVGSKEDWEHAIGAYRKIAYIPRPAPAWQPKEGEAVFIVRGDNTDVSVVRFTSIDDDGLWRIVTAKGQEQGFTPSLIKPFDPAKIGLPWYQI